MNTEYDIGLIGLGAMGRNLQLNIAEKNFTVIGLDKDPTKVLTVKKQGAANTEATTDLNEFVKSLRRPRQILFLVPAGAPVDAVLQELTPLLEVDDLLIDAGNSDFTDTDLRQKEIEKKGFLFMGLGVSGGEAGARHGPSLMPGGPRKAFDRIRPILEAIAAKANGEPCVAYLGPGSAGHYVKMVHNGIEYGIMQLIAETYHLLKIALGMSNDECHALFEKWNQTELNSYLLEITAQIFLQKDGDARLIDLVQGVAKQKGTGMWMCREAMTLQVPVPTIDAAVGARDLSTASIDRTSIHNAVYGPKPTLAVEKQFFLHKLCNSYYFGVVLTFAQGMALLQRASDVHGYGFDLETVARIWRNGCIIRAALLDDIARVFHENPKCSNLLLDSKLGREICERQADLRAVIQAGVVSGIPLPAMMSSLSYFDGARSDWLPANLIQAQRDYFGAHGFERTDKLGQFHNNWGAQP